MVSEQFSLCWDEFHKNMSSGMHSLLESEDLVDVTIAVEGRHLKAHKMVLSVCSPYFRELFKETPCKHPIVFLKDVSYIVMSELLQFMYQGEVQVSQENLTTFINTAEALQIKGLTEHANGSSERVKEPRQENKVAPERPRAERTSPVSVVKTEPAVVGAATSASSDEHFMQLKTEPYDPDEKFTDDPLEDINEDYSMMGDEETEAGTSADGTTGGQVFNEDIPMGLEEDAGAANSSLIPEKSKVVYEKMYFSFRDWCSENEVKRIGEDVVLAFFEQKSKSVKPVTLWSTYSMLKTMLSVKDGIDLKSYPKVVPFLKRKCEGYRPKKSAILTEEEINRFIREADDQTYLLLKTVLIMGVAGACRCEELVKLTIENVEDMGHILIVKVLDTKTHSDRTFTVTNINYIEIYRKYRALRPSHAVSDRLFLKYINGKCCNQVVGINKIGEMPSLIARYLGKKDFKIFTGHCFRKSSAALLAIAGSTRRRLQIIF